MLKGVIGAMPAVFRAPGTGRDQMQTSHMQRLYLAHIAPETFLEDLVLLLLNCRVIHQSIQVKVE